MNASQRKHILERIKEIEVNHLAAINTASKSTQLPPLNDLAKVKLIIARKAKFVKPSLPDKTERYYYNSPSLVSCYEFPQEIEINQHNEKATTRSENQKRKLRADTQALRDRVLISEEELTIADLQKFESNDYTREEV